MTEQIFSKLNENGIGINFFNEPETFFRSKLILQCRVQRFEIN